MGNLEGYYMGVSHRAGPKVGNLAREWMVRYIAANG